MYIVFLVWFIVVYFRLDLLPGVNFWGQKCKSNNFYLCYNRQVVSLSANVGLTGA